MKWFNKKVENKQGQIQQRKFIAATSSRLQNWVYSYQRINKQLRDDSIQMILKSRELAKNNDFIIGYLNLLQRNIIGHNGFRLQLKARNSDGSIDVVGNDIIETLWNEFQRKGNVSATMSGRDLAILIMRTLVIDGEVFLHKIKDGKFGYRYELIDTLDVDFMFNQMNLPNGEKIVMGIKLDKNNKPISYFIKDSHHTDYYCNSCRRIEVPADEIIHIFRPYFVGQCRGYTMLSSVILNLNQLDGYVEAEVVGARLAACNQAFLVQTNAGGDLLEEADVQGQLFQEYSPGTIRYLPNGFDIKAFNSTHPNSNFGGFLKSCLRSISNAIGVSYNKATSDYEAVNYSSLRESQLEDRMTYRELQTFLVESYMDEMYANFLKAVLINNLSNIPIAKFDKFLHHEWKLNTWEWIDPTKEVNAIKTKLELRLTDPITEIEKMGGDYHQVLNRWKLWEDKKEELGINLDDAEIIKVVKDENTNTQEDIDDEN